MSTYDEPEVVPIPHRCQMGTIYRPRLLGGTSIKRPATIAVTVKAAAPAGSWVLTMNQFHRVISLDPTRAQREEQSYFYPGFADGEPVVGRGFVA